MSFRKPITTLGGLTWWKNIMQTEHFIMQKHKSKVPIWRYRYRIILREKRMEIANSNDYEEILFDWEYLERNAVPQIEAQIDIGKMITEINYVEILQKIIRYI